MSFSATLICTTSDGLSPTLARHHLPPRTPLLLWNLEGYEQALHEDLHTDTTLRVLDPKPDFGRHISPARPAARQAKTAPRWSSSLLLHGPLRRPLRTRPLSCCAPNADHK